MPPDLKIVYVTTQLYPTERSILASPYYDKIHIGCSNELLAVAHPIPSMYLRHSLSPEQRSYVYSHVTAMIERADLPDTFIAQAQVTRNNLISVREEELQTPPSTTTEWETARSEVRSDTTIRANPASGAVQPNIVNHTNDNVVANDIQLITNDSRIRAWNSGVPVGRAPTDALTHALDSSWYSDGSHNENHPPKYTPRPSLDEQTVADEIAPGQFHPEQSNTQHVNHEQPAACTTNARVANTDYANNLRANNGLANNRQVYNDQDNNQYSNRQVNNGQLNNEHANGRVTAPTHLVPSNQMSTPVPPQPMAGLSEFIALETRVIELDALVGQHGQHASLEGTQQAIRAAHQAILNARLSERNDSAEYVEAQSATAVAECVAEEAFLAMAMRASATHKDATADDYQMQEQIQAVINHTREMSLNGTARSQSNTPAQHGPRAQQGPRTRQQPPIQTPRIHSVSRPISPVHELPGSTPGGHQYHNRSSFGGFGSSPFTSRAPADQMHFPLPDDRHLNRYTPLRNGWGHADTGYRATEYWGPPRTPYQYPPMAGPLQRFPNLPISPYPGMDNGYAGHGVGPHHLYGPSMIEQSSPHSQHETPIFIGGGRYMTASELEDHNRWHSIPARFRDRRYPRGQPRGSPYGPNMFPPH